MLLYCKKHGRADTRGRIRSFRLTLARPVPMASPTGSDCWPVIALHTAQVGSPHMQWFKVTRTRV
jgi:hypothetical protein